MTPLEEAAGRNFLAGYNCAQAVLLALAEPLGLEAETALKLASSFGGGFGRLREVCGAFSALCMAAGLQKGYADPTDSAAKAAHYARIQALAAAFRESEGSLLCRELMERPAESPVPEARTPAYYAARPACLSAVRAAARLAETLF